MQTCHVSHIPLWMSLSLKFMLYIHDLAAIQFPSTINFLHEGVVLYMDHSFRDDYKVVGFQRTLPHYSSHKSTHGIFEFPDYLPKSGLIMWSLRLCCNQTSSLAYKCSLLRIWLSSQNFRRTTACTTTLILKNMECLQDPYNLVPARRQGLVANGHNHFHSQDRACVCMYDTKNLWSMISFVCNKLEH